MKKWAFLVGVSEYKHRQYFRKLNHAKRHVKVFKKILDDCGEFEKVIILTEGEGKEKRPTKNNIMEQYLDLLNEIKPNDLFIVYFICHGGFLDDGTMCIFPKNASKKSSVILKSTSIPLSYFMENEKISYSPDEWNVFFFLDICRAHIEIKSLSLSEEPPQGPTEEPMPSNIGPLGISRFYACSTKKKAYVFDDESGEESGLFSYALLKFFKRGIHKPPLKYGDLVTDVKKEVEKILKNYPIPFQLPKNESNEEAGKVTLIGDVPPFADKKTRDFEITINKNDNTISVKIDNEDDIDGTINYDDDEDKCINRILANANFLITNSNPPRDFMELSIGDLLYKILFNGKVKEKFEEMLKDVKKKDQYLRVKLFFKESSRILSNLPWEYLYYDDLNTFLATDKNVLLSHYFINSKKYEKSSSLKILLVVSEKENDVADTIENLTDNYSVITVDRLDNKPDISRLKRKIENKDYNIIHFIGKVDLENYRSSIVLFEENEEKLLPVKKLIKSFPNYEEKEEGKYLLPIIIISPIDYKNGRNSVLGKYSSFARNFIKKGFPAIIIFQYPISNREAKYFCSDFYRQIAKEKKIDVALQSGRFRITKASEKPHSKRDFGTPVLYTQIYDNIIELKGESRASKKTAIEPFLKEIIGTRTAIKTRLIDIQKPRINLKYDVYQDGYDPIISRDKSISSGEIESLEETRGSLDPEVIKRDTIDKVIDVGIKKAIKKRKSHEISSDKYIKIIGEINYLREEFEKIPREELKGEIIEILEYKRDEKETDRMIKLIYEAMLGAIPFKKQSKTSKFHTTTI